MRAIVLAAGLGSRLKPWTLEHPKALVPVGGVPMLERVLCKLESENFTDIVVTAHHFYPQVVDFVRDYSANSSMTSGDCSGSGNCSAQENPPAIKVSVEKDVLLDTGGGVLQASALSTEDGAVLIHNVDILSDAKLGEMMDWHNATGNDITLLTSDRDTTRHLLFDKEGVLRGWRNETTGQVRMIGEDVGAQESLIARAFSGIYILSQKAIDDLKKFAAEKKFPDGVFPIMDYFLAVRHDIIRREYHVPSLGLIDIGKPHTLQQADQLFSDDDCKSGGHC